MIIHVLAGDALVENFKHYVLDGEIIVCRECLVEGDCRAESLEDFWHVRAGFITETYGGSKDEYFKNVASEFEKLKNLARSDAEVNLWFEYELFCQVNLWFCLYLLRESEAAIFRTAPIVRTEEEIWKGFGGLEPEDLGKCFAERVKFDESDILLGADLWKAYQTADYEMLEKLSARESHCFPYLRETCRAEIEKTSRPKEILQGIIAKGASDFAEIFPEFSNQAGVYGFGDAQVKRILHEFSPNL